MSISIRRAVRSALLATTPAAVFAVQPAVAFAQSGTAQQVEISAQPLSQTLAEIARRYGTSLRASGDLTQGKRAPRVTGNLTAKQAIERALAGSGLTYRRSRSGGYVVMRAGREPAASQEPTSGTNESRSSQDVERDPIIVTGTKQNVDAQDTVESVEVFTAERFEAENLFTISDAVARTPNVSIISDNINTINIRGIERNGTAGAGQGVAINVFQDGVPLSDRAVIAGATTAWDVEQLEILRGSQSTVQGRNSIAGAVVIQSKKPTFDWEAAARLRVAEFDTYQISGAISGPLVADEIAFRMSVDYQETEGFITDGIAGGPFAPRENLVARGRLLLEPEAIEGLTALLTVEYSERMQMGANSVVSEPGAIGFDPRDRVSFQTTITNNDTESWRYIADISLDLSERATLKLLGTYEDTRRRFAGDSRQENPFGLIGNTIDARFDIYSAEARVEFDFDKLTGFIGGYYFSSNRDTETSAIDEIGRFFPFPLDPEQSLFSINQSINESVENYAFFASWRYQPSTNWTVDLSLRYDDETFSTAAGAGNVTITPDTCVGTAPGIIFGMPGPFMTRPCADAAALFAEEPDPLQSDSLGVLLPSGSLTYNFNDDISVFVGYRRGYRAGGTFLQSSVETFGDDQTFSIVSFDPEFLNTYEAGFRSQSPDKKVTVNGTLFYSEYEDQQISFTDEVGRQIVDNAGATSLYGIELMVQYKATSNFDFFGSLGLLETRVDEFLFFPNDPDTDEDESLDLAGNELSRSPAVTFNLGANYEDSSGVFANASVNYQSSYFSDIFNLSEAELGDGLTERVEAAAIFNVNIGYEFANRFTVRAYANNLFNVTSPQNINISASRAARGLDDVSDNVRQFNLRPPQTFGISIDATF